MASRIFIFLKFFEDTFKKGPPEAVITMCSIEFLIFKLFLIL